MTIRPVIMYFYRFLFIASAYSTFNIYYSEQKSPHRLGIFTTHSEPDAQSYFVGKQSERLSASGSPPTGLTAYESRLGPVPTHKPRTPSGRRAFLQLGAGFRPSSPWVHAAMQPAAAYAHHHLAAIVPARCSGRPMARSRRGPGQAHIHQAPEQHGRARHGRPLAAARILANGGVVATFLRAGLAHHYGDRGHVAGGVPPDVRTGAAAAVLPRPSARASM